MAGQARRLVVLGLLGVAFVLGLLGLLLEWWQIELTVGSTTIDFFSARPYTADFSTFGDDAPPPALDDVLDTDTILAGVFLTVALVAIVGALVALMVGMLRSPLPNLLPIALAGAAALMGLIVVVLAAVAWPGAWQSDLEDAFTSSGEEDGADDARLFEPSWWGSQEVAGTPATVDYSPSAGWFLAIVGYVLLPVAAIVTLQVPWGFLAGDTPGPRTHYLPPAAAAPPPPLPVRPQPAPPTQPRTGPATRPDAPAGKHRRIAVVSKTKPQCQKR